MASTPASLAPHYLETRPDPSKSSALLNAQMAHRMRLVSFWGIGPGDRVLEIGCGQGDTTVVLADAVGDAGSVVALDPGARDYGSPHTIGDSQDYILASPIGKRVTFHTPCFPLTHLASLPHATPSSPGKPTYTYTHAVLSHSIYYFSSPSVLPELIAALTPHCEKICIAEWSLVASSLTSVPHVLTAQLWSALENKRVKESMGNVRTALSPSQITKTVLAVSSEGGAESNDAKTVWRLEKEDTAETGAGMQDGFWEVSDVLSSREKELAMLKANGVSEREVVGFEGAFDAIAAAVERVQGGVKQVKCMDYWVGVFSRV